MCRRRGKEKSGRWRGEGREGVDEEVRREPVYEEVREERRGKLGCALVMRRVKSSIPLK